MPLRALTLDRGGDLGERMGGGGEVAVGELSGGVLYMLWGGDVLMARLMGFVWRRQCGLRTSSSWGGDDFV